MIWLARSALIATGIGLMAWEGSYQASPGVLFAVAAGCFLAAPFIGSRQ